MKVIISFTLSSSPSFHPETEMLQNAFQNIPDNTQLIIDPSHGSRLAVPGEFLSEDSERKRDSPEHVQKG
jgi:hypothetical protein